MEISKVLLTDHKLLKTETGYKCDNCHQNWKNKPRKKCPGTRIIKKSKREIEKLERTHWKNQEYWLENSLLNRNLRPTTLSACVKKGKDYLYLYDPQGETEKIDPDLPPVVACLSCDRDTERQTDSHCFKSELGLRRLNLKPGEAEPVAVYWYYDGFKPLYNRADCETYMKSPATKHLGVL